MKFGCSCTISIRKITDYSRLSILETRSYFCNDNIIVSKVSKSRFYIFPGLSSNVWLLLKPSCKSGIDIKPTVVSSGTAFLGFTVNSDPIRTHSQLSGISNGISSSTCSSVVPAPYPLGRLRITADRFVLIFLDFTFVN